MMSNRLLALIVLSTLTIAATAAERADAVLVTNGAGAPVPVLVTNPQSAAAPAPKSIFTDVFSSVSATIMPAPGTGKRFVARHFSVVMFSNNSAVSLNDANCVLSMHQGSTSFSIATLSLQHADLVGAMGVSQDAYYVLGPGDSLEMICTSNPANSAGRVTVSGDGLWGQ